jgi:hypothetical protein
MKLLATAALVFVPALVFAVPGEPVDALRPRQLADLKTFFHGEPATPPKAPRPKVTATVSTAEGVKADAQIETFLRALATAIQLRDGKRMLPRLAANFSMGAMPDGIEAPAAFAQGIGRIAGPTEIFVRSIESKNGERTAQIEFRYPNQTRNKTMTFTADGKLLSTDLFTVKIEPRGHF